MNNATSVRLRLHRNGYVPLPLEGKRPLVAGWQNVQPDEAMIRGWERDYPGLTNTGIRATECPVIDIDILDPAGVRLVLGAIKPGQNLLYRTGRAPKVAILFRASRPFQKMAHVYRSPDGTTHKIEVLCDGQQMAAFGIHPDTKKPFTWEPYDPTVVGRHELPELTEETARRFLAACDRRLELNGWTVPVEPPRISEWRKPKRSQAPEAIERSIDGVLGKMGTAVQGNVQCMAYWGCKRLREKVEENYLEREEAIGLAIAAAVRGGLSYKRAAEVANRIIKR